MGPVPGRLVHPSTRRRVAAVTAAVHVAHRTGGTRHTPQSVAAPEPLRPLPPLASANGDEPVALAVEVDRKVPGSGNRAAGGHQFWPAQPLTADIYPRPRDARPAGPSPVTGGSAA